VGGLILLALVLITVSFRSSALDGVQGTAADVLRPFEVAANRVSRPFRDSVGWAHGLVNAKSENKRLRGQVASLQRDLVNAHTAESENATLKRLLDYKGPPSEADFRRVNAGVITDPQNALSQSITIDAGSADGVRAGDVVTSPDGLVGTVARTSGSVARVTLITDELSAVTATDSRHQSAVGLVSPGNSAGVLIFDLVPKAEIVSVGDTVITAGTVPKASQPSIFPRGIVVGTVTSESDNDVDAFKNIQVQPSVDFGSLRAVMVLVPKSR
jgi:rod shape-determining protein MreC